MFRPGLGIDPLWPPFPPLGPLHWLMLRMTRKASRTAFIYLYIYFDQSTPALGLQDHSMMVSVHTCEVLMKHLRPSPDQVQVLDMASGLVAKLMSSRGFRHLVGVDGSGAMLEEAQQTGLYQDIHMALLGTQALPTEPDQFDVVAIVGTLYPGFVPVSVVRELCNAAKPGGLIVMTRGNYQRPAHILYTAELHCELEQMERAGLWREVEVSDPHQPQEVLSGSIYLYQKLE